MRLMLSSVLSLAIGSIIIQVPFGLSDCLANFNASTGKIIHVFLLQEYKLTLYLIMKFFMASIYEMD
jgi:hypothetical protein